MRAILPPVAIASLGIHVWVHITNPVRFEQVNPRMKRIGKTDLSLMRSRSIAPSFQQQEMKAVINHPAGVPIPVVV